MEGLWMKKMEKKLHQVELQASGAQVNSLYSTDSNLVTMENYVPGKRADLWVKRFERYGKYSGWTEKRMLQAFGVKMSGAAELWYDKVKPGDKKDFKSLKKTFLSQFTSNRSKWVSQAALLERKQQEGEKLDDYLLDIQAKCLALDKNAGEQLFHFVQGLRPSLKAFVMSSNPLTLADAHSKARLGESVLQLTEKESTGAGNISEIRTADAGTRAMQLELSDLRQKLELMNLRDRRARSLSPAQPTHSTGEYYGSNRAPYKGPPGTPTMRNFGRTTDSRPICTNCRRVGHNSFSCRQNLQCTNCNKPGHTARECRSGRYNALHDSRPQEGHRPYQGAPRNPNPYRNGPSSSSATPGRPIRGPGNW
jgi:hypothetical protein